MDGFEEMQSNQFVMAVARVLMLANEAAVLHGAVPAKSLISIAKEPSPSGPVWRISYMPRDYVIEEAVI